MIDFYCNRQITMPFLRTYIDFKARSSVQVTQYITHTIKCVKTLIRECFKKSHYLIATVRKKRTLQITSNRISSSPTVLDSCTSNKFISCQLEDLFFHFSNSPQFFLPTAKIKCAKFVFLQRIRKEKQKQKRKKKKEKNQKKK